MKTLTKLILSAVILTTAIASQAEWVNGHFRSNGTYVNSYYRTPANGTPYDNLSYRGYRSQQPGYVSPRSSGLNSSWSCPTPLPNYGNHNFNATPRPYTGNQSTKQQNRRSSSYVF